MKKWQKGLLGFGLFIVILVPFSFVLNHLRLEAFRRDWQRAALAKTDSNAQTVTRVPAARSRESIAAHNAFTSSTLILSATTSAGTEANLIPLQTTPQSNTISQSASAEKKLELMLRSTYDASRGTRRQRLGILADKCFMMGYIGLLKSVDAGVWACGGSLPDSVYLEIGSESFRLGDREIAKYYLHRALETNGPIPNRAWYQQMEAFAAAAPE